MTKNSFVVEVTFKELNAKYRVEKKEINLIIGELKQTLIAKKTKVKKTEPRISQISQNQVFQVSQKQVYKGLNREKKVTELSRTLKIVSNFGVISGV